MEAVQNMENYEELKESTKNILQVITSNDLYYGLFLVVLLAVLLKITDIIFRPILKNKSPMILFLKACIKVFLCVSLGFRIFALIPGMKDFANQILLSSSLLVVVLGFVFQEGLSNIVHGFILSVFRPFKIGDRVSVTIDGEGITGYIREINARHTVIQNIINSAHVIVPNAKMDTCVIGNNYYDGNTTSTSFLDVQITYESDLNKAMMVMAAEVEAHPLVKQAMLDKGLPMPPTVFVRELGQNGISLRTSVVTKTVEENFAACSEIRRKIVMDFARDPALDFAYPHVHLVPSTERELQPPHYPGQETDDRRS